MTVPTFPVPLHVHSNYSLLSGTSTVESMVGGAKSLGFDAIALTDTNNLYAAPKFFEEAKKAGIKPVLGCEIVKEDESVILIARSRTGYANLCAILTKLNLEPNSLLSDALTAHHDGLFMLVGGSVQGAGDCERPRGSCCEPARLLSSGIPTESVFIALKRPCSPLGRERELINLARKLGLGLVATAPAHLLDESEHEVHVLLSAIRENTSIHEAASRATARRGDYLRNPEEMNELFADAPEALANTRRIADACEFELFSETTYFPNFPVPSGMSAKELLLSLCEEKLAWCYGCGDGIGRARERLTHEIEVISKLGFTEYFLVVGDIVRFAREKGIPVVGRGSGASSIVAYLLGVTNVDPLRYNLYFERFLNETRKDWPDLDIDLSWHRRDEVIEYVYRTYGRDRVAMISTHVTMGPRLAFLEAAKALGVPMRMLSRDGRVREHTGALAEAKRLAKRIENFPRHLGIHCGGIVVSPDVLSKYVPREMASKGIVVTQYEMDGIEKAGLVKIDLLGNRALSTLEETLNLVERERGVKLSLDEIPENDERTGELLRTGSTLSCFQIESPAMRNLLVMLGASSQEETIDAIALVRPGPSSAGMKEHFVRRVRGVEKAEFVDESVLRLLGRTHGIMLYEEDVMGVLSEIAGVSLEEADSIRRAISNAKGESDLEDVKRFFLAKCDRKKRRRQVSERVWNDVVRFASYAFSRAHASGYGVLAYQSAYLKAHFPLEYMTAVMNHHQGMYSRAAHLNEAKRIGLRAVLPSVNRSGRGFTIDGGAIRVGLSQVQGLTEKTIDSIISERRRSPFDSVSDFLSRSRAGLKETESLILCGAFDFTGRTRPALFYELFTCLRGTKKKSGESSLDFVRDACAPDFTGDEQLFDERVAAEEQVLDLYVTRHPTEVGTSMISSVNEKMEISL